MNKQKILENELRFRKWVHAILIEEMIYERSETPDVLLEELLGEYGGGMSGEGFVKAMVTPFTDVLKVAKVATKDLLSIAKFNFDMITTLSPSKQKEAMKKWEERNKKLSGEWAEAMKPIDAAWEEGDAQLISFMLNPAGFLGVKALSAVGDTAMGTKDMLDDAGIHLPFVGNKNKSGGDEKSPDGIVGKGAKLLGDLTKLFFIAHHEPAGPLLSEAEGQEKEKPGGNAADGAREYIDSIPGFQQRIDKDAKTLIDSRQEYVNEIMQMFEAQITLLTNLSNAQDLGSFNAAIQQAAQGGVDIGGAGLDSFQADIDAGVSNVLSDPKAREGFVASYLEQQGQAVPKGEPVPDVSDDQLIPEIEKVIFMDAKLGVQEQLFSGTQELKKQAIDAVMEGVPEQKQWPLIKQTALGSEYLSMIEKTVQKIEAA